MAQESDETGVHDGTTVSVNQIMRDGATNGGEDRGPAVCWAAIENEAGG